MNPITWFRTSRDGGRQPAAHMTWAHTSVGRTISRTGVFLKRQIWIWPILAVLLLSIIGFFVRRSIETTMRDGLKSQLQTIVDLEASMLETWSHVQESNAQSLANNVDIRQTIYPLLEAPQGDVSKATEAVSTLRAKLEKSLGPALTAHQYVGYFVADKKKRIVASGRTEIIGQVDIPEYTGLLSRALDGITNVSAPFASVVAMKDDTGRSRTGVPTMIVSAPIRDDSFQVVGVLALRIDPDKEFGRVMSLGRFGQSGETYAIDKTSRMVSNSRFDDSLILLGLLPDQEHSRSILQLLVRDPGGNITTGHRPTARRNELPLTRAATEVIAQRAGVDVEGYRDYRGVNVVGAWKWLSGGDVGVITEVDYDEAFHPLAILRWVFWGLFALLALSAAAIFVFSLMLARSRREAQKQPSRLSRSANTSSNASSDPAAWAWSTKATMLCSAGPRRSRCSMSTKSTKAPWSASSARCRSRASSTIRTRLRFTTTAAHPKACFTMRWSTSTVSTCKRSSRDMVRSQCRV